MGSVIINGPTKCKCGVELTFQTTYAVWKGAQLGPLCRACYLEEQAKRFWDAYKDSVIRRSLAFPTATWSGLDPALKLAVIDGLEAVL